MKDNNYLKNNWHAIHGTDTAIDAVTQEGCQCDMHLKIREKKPPEKSYMYTTHNYDALNSTEYAISRYG